MTRLAPVALAALVSSCLVGNTRAIAQGADTLEWLDDYDEALALAKRTGRPLFVEFRCSP